MSDFIVTARKWRPLFFKDVVGQEHITQTLKNAVRNNRVHHAYLFSGPRGVGKTTTARILSRSINCLNPQDAEPCNKCENCISVMEGRSMDVIEIDGASNNSVDDIRKLRENAKYPPSNGKFKMYIIDEVHMLSNAAFNALLKTLEEPPPHLLFIFATTEVHKVLPTITSRCQRFDFRRMEIDDIKKQILFIAEKENISIDDESLTVIAKKGDGSMRDAQSIFDQVITFCGKNVVYSEMADAMNLIDIEFFFKITTAVYEKNSEMIFELTNTIIRKGYDFQETLRGLLEHLRNLTAVNLTQDTSIIEASQQTKQRYLEESRKFNKLDLIRMMNHISIAEHSLKTASQPRIKFELTMLQMANMDSTVEISSLLSELSSLKKNNLINLGIQQPVVKQMSGSFSKTGSKPGSLSDYNSEDGKTTKIIRKLNPEQFVAQWNEFVMMDIVSSSGFKFNSIKPELKGRTVILFCEFGFEKQYLDRKKDDLAMLVQNLFDLIINFEIEIKQNLKPDPVENYEILKDQISFAGEPKIKYDSQSVADLHPVEKILIENFGAELLIDYNKGH